MQQSLQQFLPREYEYLTKNKKIQYDGINLKTDYLINIIHELILRFYFTNEIKFDMWSVILRKKYGVNYHVYMKYLSEKGIISLVSNYYFGKKTKTYKLNIDVRDVIRCKITDAVLLKKHGRDYFYKNFYGADASPIDPAIRDLLIDDLYHVGLDYNRAIDYLSELKSNGGIDACKYFKNISSIEAIKVGHIFYKFDQFGRMHTNFTILKKYIRQTFLDIDGHEICEIDVKNSQPFFFACFLKKELGNDLSREIERYISSVKNGLIYDEFMEKFPEDLTYKEEAKIMVYKVLFGSNRDERKENRMFRELYPTIYSYIKEFKSMRDSYKELAHELQLLESNFIYGEVVSEIKRKFPHIRLFTIHDSLMFPCKYKEEVMLIFNQHLKKLI